MIVGSTSQKFRKRFLGEKANEVDYTPLKKDTIKFAKGNENKKGFGI